MRFSGGRGAESIAFSKEFFGDVGEVRSPVRDVTLVDVVFCGRVRDFAELALSRAAGGR